MAIFVLTRTNRQTIIVLTDDYFIPAHARGVINSSTMPEYACWLLVWAWLTYDLLQLRTTSHALKGWL